MDLIITKLFPIFCFWGTGILLRYLKFARESQAEFLLKLVFFLTLPALVFIKVSEASIAPDKLYLPFINAGVNLLCMLAVLLFSRYSELPRNKVGSMMVSAMIINNVFMFPFILAGFGNSGFVDAVLFDFGNALTTATITYLLAFKYGTEQASPHLPAAKLFKSPLFWSLPAALLVNISGWRIPLPVHTFFDSLGSMTSPLVLISLGLFFQLRIKEVRLVSVTIFIRVVFGCLCGTALALLLGLSGQTLHVVMLCSAGPVGFAALTFSSVAGLDKAFVSNTVSISILCAIVYVSLFLMLLT